MEHNEEYYNKNNICSLCEGKKEFTFFNNITQRKQYQPCICGDGTRVGELHQRLRTEKSCHDTTMKDLKLLRKWVKESSECKICKGDQFRTPALTNCKECGLPGMAAWGG